MPSIRVRLSLGRTRHRSACGRILLTELLRVPARRHADVADGAARSGTCPARGTFDRCAARRIGTGDGLVAESPSFGGRHAEAIPPTLRPEVAREDIGAPLLGNRSGVGRRAKAAHDRRHPGDRARSTDALESRPPRNAPLAPLLLGHRPSLARTTAQFPICAEKASSAICGNFPAPTCSFSVGFLPSGTQRKLQPRRG
jgi:hypothetical protein